MERLCWLRRRNDASPEASFQDGLRRLTATGRASRRSEELPLGGRAHGRTTSFPCRAGRPGELPSRRPTMAPRSSRRPIDPKPQPSPIRRLGRSLRDPPDEARPQPGDAVRVPVRPLRAGREPHRHRGQDELRSGCPRVRSRTRRPPQCVCPEWSRPRARRGVPPLPDRSRRRRAVPRRPAADRSAVPHAPASRRRSGDGARGRPAPCGCRPWHRDGCFRNRGSPRSVPPRFRSPDGPCASTLSTAATMRSRRRMPSPSGRSSPHAGLRRPRSARRSRSFGEDRGATRGRTRTGRPHRRLPHRREPDRRRMRQVRLPTHAAWKGGRADPERSPSRSDGPCRSGVPPAVHGCASPSSSRRSSLRGGSLDQTGKDQLDQRQHLAGGIRDRTRASGTGVHLQTR
ncbi:hypothetical protein MET9862_02874 [Methylobacterium symbioticum]|uniref:Uncharacterized protein n=1 Tax=Methylobacterium symbioticum TaxID=2584084 RepID=A0A509EFU7_9HYPH|nr:hypothetical protein MET9862_02874 [Methylobacterium symbioticum]